MFARKLKALGWHHPDTFSIDNDPDVRWLIIWLEDLKLRFYKIDERAALRDVESKDWISALKKYLKDLNCPVEDLSQKSAVINWLLSHAIQLQYSEDAEKYNQADEKRKINMSRDDQDVFTKLDENDPHLISSIESLRKMLDIPQHHDNSIVLQAITKLIEERLSKDAIDDAKKKKATTTTTTEYLSLENTSLGFDTNDYLINDAAKILRLLQLHNLRELQTRINQAIVSVQKLSADPKTDQSLGRVGR